MKRAYGYLLVAAIVAISFVAGINAGKWMQSRKDAGLMLQIPQPEKVVGAVAWKPYVCIVYIDKYGNQTPCR